MNPSAANNAYLYAAYIVVGVIHGLYLLSLISRSRYLKREAQELRKSLPR